MVERLPLGLGDGCSPLLVGCGGNMPHKAQHGAEAVKFGRAGPQRAAGKVDVSITERFTFPMWKQGEGQNCTGDEFQHHAVSRWLLQRHQRPQRREPQSSPVSVCIVWWELLLPCSPAAPVPPTHTPVRP